MTTQAIFDPAKYKRTTREQWQDAAEAWHRWGTAIENWLGAATEEMLDMADVKAGSRVLDVAAGAGGQTIAAAKRVGTNGFVLATDIAPKILEYAAAEARKAGLTNVDTQEQDGEQLNVTGDLFDVAISRVGLIYFPDQHKALSQIYKALKPGGRIAAIVYTTAESNKFFSIPVSIIRRRAQLPPPLSGQPGPFSLGNPSVLEDLYKQAGFRNVQVKVVPAPVRMSSAAECVRFERESFGALHQMLSNISSQAERESVWDEIETELKQFEGPDGFEGPCEMLIGIGMK